VLILPFGGKRCTGQTGQRLLEKQFNSRTEGIIPEFLPYIMDASH
jgi:hypothetical protein